MDAVTLNCPTCGAAAAAGATACAFCRARLATVGCPSCFGLVFVGSRHCAHCGARTEQPAGGGDAGARCPHGCGPLRLVQLGGVALRECTDCGGVWLDEPTFQRLCSDEEWVGACKGKRPTTFPATWPCASPRWSRIPHTPPVGRSAPRDAPRRSSSTIPTASSTPSSARAPRAIQIPAGSLSPGTRRST